MWNAEVMKTRTFETQLKHLFTALELEGITARANFSCCSSCGWAELANELHPGAPAVFYNQQSAANLRDQRKRSKPQNVYLQWGIIHEDNEEEMVKLGTRIVAAATLRGFAVEWQGTGAKCIRLGALGTTLPIKELV